MENEERIVVALESIANELKISRKQEQLKLLYELDKHFFNARKDEFDYRHMALSFPYWEDIDFKNEIQDKTVILLVDLEEKVEREKQYQSALNQRASNGVPLPPRYTRMRDDSIEKLASVKKSIEDYYPDDLKLLFKLR